MNATLVCVSPIPPGRRSRSGSSPAKPCRGCSGSSSSCSSDEEGTVGKQILGAPSKHAQQTVVTFKRGPPPLPVSRVWNPAASFSPRSSRYQQAAAAAGYDVVNQLSAGTFADVFILVKRTTGERFAGKFYACKPAPDGLPRSRLGAEHVVRAEMHRKRELEMLRRVTAANISNVAHLVASFPEGAGDFPEIWCTVTDLAEEGDLLSFTMQWNSRFNEINCRKIARGLFSGLEQLHRHRIVHCDVKPENTLLKDGADMEAVVIGDLGLAKLTESQDPGVRLSERNPQDMPEKREGIFRGTLEYAAPETLRSGLIVYESDVWSAGVTCLSLLIGYNPFGVALGEAVCGEAGAQAASAADVQRAALRDVWTSLLSCRCSASAESFLRAALAEAPEDRPSASQCLAHRWLRK